MSLETIMWTLPVLMLVLLLLGMRVGYVLLAVGLAGATFALDPAQPTSIGRELWSSTNSYTLTAIPLYVLMAELLLLSGITQDAYRAVTRVLSFLPGGAAYANIAASSVFAAISGSSVANAAALGTISAPSMVNMGYGKRLTFGTIAAGGVLGILMPPSAALIIYASMTGLSVGRLFLAGIIPALMLAALFTCTIALWSLIRRSSTPQGEPLKGWQELKHAAVILLPLLALIVVILGGIYAGIFTPTEAGGVGALSAAVITAFKRQLTVDNIRTAAKNSVSMTCMIMLIIAGAAALTYVMGMLALPALLTEGVLATGFSPTTLLILVALLYVVLGLFIESVSLIILTVPVIYPVLTALGIDGIWLGIYIVMLVEIGLLTPPVGMNLYVLERIQAGQTMQDIILGAIPFIGAIFLGILLLLAFPDIATWLPRWAS